MYRKKLMRVALAGIMAATVITSSVPVSAADVNAEAKQEETKKDGEVKDDSEKKTSQVTVYFTHGKAIVDKDYLTAVKGEKITYAKIAMLLGVPEGYDIESPQTVYTPSKDEEELNISLTKKQKPEVLKKTVKINYYDEVAEKQVAEVEAKVANNVTKLDKATVESNLPAGYVVRGENDYVIRDGYVYVSVKKADVESVEFNAIFREKGSNKDIAKKKVTLVKDKEYKNSVIKPFVPEGYELLDENGTFKAIANNENVLFQVVKKAPEAVETVEFNAIFREKGSNKDIAKKKLTLVKDKQYKNSVVKPFVPEGYELLDENGTFKAIADNENVLFQVVKKTPADANEIVEFNAIFREKGSTENVGKIKFKLEKDKVYSNKLMANFVPKGYKLLDENGTFKVIANGENVLFQVIKTEREAVLTVTFETTDGKVVGKEVCKKVGKDGEDAVFKLGEDFQLPKGYKVSNDRDQITEITIPYGSVGGHTMVVEETARETKDVHLVYYNVENNENISDKVLTVGIHDTVVHIENVKKYLPEGWVLSKEGDPFVIDANGNVKIGIVRDIEASKEIKIVYFDHKSKEEVKNVVVSVDKDATEMEAAYVRRNLPNGYVIVDEDGRFPIEVDGTTRVAVAKATDAEEIKPATPVEKPEKPSKDENKKEEKKDNSKKAPKTSDEANPFAAALPAGLSLAAILALLVKKFK